MSIFVKVKKALAIVFCFLYLVSSAGIHVNLHYCAGKIKSISFLHSDEADCCGKMMKKKKDCCKEKTVTVQVKNDKAQASKQLLVEPTHIAKDLIPVTDIHFSISKPGGSLLLAYSEPPDVGLQKVFLSIRSLRI